MRFYNIEMKGKLILEKPSSAPPYNPADEGRIFYYNDTLYYSDSTANTVLSTTGGGAASGNAAALEGHPGAYYLCADNITGVIDADELQGFAGSYYLDLLNATGTLSIVNGGTGATNIATARANLCTPRLDGGNTYCGGTHTIWGLENTNAPLMVYNSSTTCCNFVQYIQNYGCGNGLYVSSPWNKGICVHSGQCANASVDISSWVIANRSALNILARSGASGACIRSCCNHGLRSTSDVSYAVGGNTAYCVLSSKNLKYLETVCLSNCVRETPLNVYKYYWEDSNNKGFNQTISPTAEDFDNTFNVNHSKDGEEYDGLWSVEGAALGLGIENLKEIDKLKFIVKELYSCIQKLEGKE